MKIQVTTLRQIVKVEFPPGIDPYLLAMAAGVHYMTAWNWLKHGKVNERYIPIIKDIPIELVKRKDNEPNK
jgi:hypothetical protein